MSVLDEITEERRQYVIGALDNACVLPKDWTTEAFCGNEESRKSALKKVFREEHIITEEEYEDVLTNNRILCKLVKLYISDIEKLRSEM